MTHLPADKQNQILEITGIIREVTNPDKIILFGSYAKGTYVEHRYLDKDGTRHEYISDYDFLVVTRDTPPRAADLEREIVSRTENMDPPVNLEIHSIEYVNKGLELGEYFFVDIVKEGILLYDTRAIEFAEPIELSDQVKREKSKRYFETWFPQAVEFIEGCRFYSGRQNYKLAAFQLHQATESLYYAFLLVFTDYKPKTHNLWKLRRKAKPFSQEFFSVFKAESDKNEKHLFDLLKRGYIDARYRTDYHIAESELAILIQKVETMVVLVETLCGQKMAGI